MKLELKHLAHYLPYGLKFKVLEGINKDNITKLDGLSLEQEGDSMMLDHMLCGTDHCHYKPILRPLSDLTKEIEHNGEKFVPLRKLEELFPCIEFYNDDELHYLFSDTDCRGEFFHSIELNLTLEISSKLLEYHFDVFGLIKVGLAIDINTLYE